MGRDYPAGAPDPHVAGGIHGLLLNPALIAGVLGCVVAQVAKVFTGMQRGEEDTPLDWSRALQSGGMPSSHTALVVAATAALGVLEGTGSGIFALALVVSLVVMYDACGVRLHASRHASLLNTLVSELPDEHPAMLVCSGRLVETIGHTPQEVAAGAAVGTMVGVVIGGLASLVIAHSAAAAAAAGKGS